ncbi:DUF4340 domain-containing protein [Treponema sp. R80B11-R83G3]
MTYKNRLIFLGTLIGVLTVTYIASVIFTSDIGSKSSSYTWLDSKTAEKTIRIAIKDADNEFELKKKNGQWFVSHNGLEYPAKQLRVEDFLKILTIRSAWTVRSTSASNHERFGLEQSASRVTIYGETVLLDLVVGNEDVNKNEIYLRKAGQNEVRSGDNAIKSYISSPVNSWYNLRLIPETENGSIDLSAVQRLSVYTPQETQVFSRKNKKWEISGISVEKPDKNAVDAYIRQILTIEGDNFENSVNSADPMFDKTSIVLELGNGRIVTIRFSEADESGRRFANVSGKDYIYSIPTWQADKLFKDASTFETQ